MWEHTQRGVSSVFRILFFPWELQFRQRFWQALFSLASALECLFGTFCFYRRGLGVSLFFFFPKAMRKKRFTCMHNMTVWAAWPTNNNQESNTDRRWHDAIFLYKMFFKINKNTCTAKVLHFFSFPPHVLFFEQGQIFKRKGNVYLNECTSVEVLKAPPEGYFTGRKLLMQKFLFCSGELKAWLQKQWS